MKFWMTSLSLASSSLLIEPSFSMVLMSSDSLVLMWARKSDSHWRSLVDEDTIEETVDAGEDKGDHLVNSHGRVLLLLEELGQLRKSA